MRYLFFLLFFFTISCQTTQRCGEEVSAFFDVGSGSTKMKVVTVNTCNQQVLNVLLREDVRVSYRDDLETAKDDRFSAQIQEQGLLVLQQLKEKAQLLQASRFHGVATAAFRKAKNASDFVFKIRAQTGIAIRIVSQAEEAQLGYRAALGQLKDKTKNPVVWDLGGGSQQMVYVDSAGQMQMYLGDLASVRFKNQIIQDIQKKSLAKVRSPNPMSATDVKKALALARTEARGVPASLVIALRDPKVQVIGVGGVLAKSVPKQIGATLGPLQESVIQKAIEIRRQMSDKDHQDAFADTNVSNLVLVSAFMQELGIVEYIPMEVSLVDGIEQ